MEEVSFDEWQKLDLRVAEILDIEDIEGADKLYKFSVNLGSELGKRTIVAGLKPYYKKEDLKGRKVILFSNLTPRILRGVESQGMMLAAVSDDHEKVHLLQPDGDIEVGSKIT